MFLLGRKILIKKKKMCLQSGSNILASIEIFSQFSGDLFVADSEDLVRLSFLELSAEFNHRGPRLLLRLSSPLFYFPSRSLHLVAPALPPSAPVPSLGLYSL